MVELKEFSKLLTKAVKKIKERDGKLIPAIHDELAYAIGKESGSCIEDWRKPHPNGKPPHPDQIRMLAQELAKQKAIDEAELEQLLDLAKFMEGHGKNTSLSPINKPRLLHNLSAPYYREFIGRMADINLIQPWLSETSKINKVMIHAAGGMGKTTLAHHIAWGYVETSRHFEAIIWVTTQEERFEGYNEEIISPIHEAPRKLTDIYKAIAICLHREDILERPAMDIRLYILRALGKQPTLLIMDNFETVKAENDIKLFLTDLPATTKVLITCREKIHLSNFEYHELKPLVESETQDLIQSHLKQIDDIKLSKEQCQALWEVTQGHTIAIVWSMGRMVHDVDIEQILGELQTARNEGEFDEKLHNSKNKLASFCFERSFAPIRGQPVARLLAAMCLFAPNQATATALQHVAHVAPEQYETAIRKLKRLAFIYEIDDRLGILPLTREFAVDSVTEEMKRHFVDYFAGLCFEVTKGNYWGGLIYNIKAIEKELANCEKAINLAYDLKVWPKAKFLFFGLIHILNGNVYRKIRIEYTKKLLELLDEFDKSDVELHALCYIDGLGWAYLANRQYEDCVLELNKGLEIAKRHELIECEIMAHINLAKKVLYSDINNKTEFWTFICRAENLPSNSSRHQAGIYEAKLFFYRHHGKWEEALDVCKQAYKLNQNEQETIEAGWFERFLGEIYLQLAKRPKLSDQEVQYLRVSAKDSFDKSIKVRLKFSEYKNLSMAYMGLALISLYDENVSKALEYAKEARLINEYYVLHDELAAINAFIENPTLDFDLSQFDLF